jgi:predicted metal-dependent hydrolase
MLKFMYGYRGFMTRQIPTLLAFLRPKFHPNDYDTTELLNKWRAELGFNPH